MKLFFDEVKELREIAKELPYDFWVTLVGDTITEEALPTYESWLMDVEGIDQVETAEMVGLNGSDNGPEKKIVMGTYLISICICLEELICAR